MIPKITIKAAMIIDINTYMDPDKLKAMYLDFTACIRAFILSIIET